MKHLWLSLLFCVISVALIACTNSSSSSERPAGNVANTGPSVSMGNTTQTSSADDTGNANTGDTFSERLQNRRRRKTHAPQNGTAAGVEFRPAPDESEIATTMNVDGQPVEIRVFKADPSLERVESTWVSEKQRSLKITFKDGRVVDVSTDKFSSLLDVSPAELKVLADGR